jgi:hypothetical protein
LADKKGSAREFDKPLIGVAEAAIIPADNSAVTERLEYPNSGIVRGLLACVTPYLTVCSGGPSRRALAFEPSNHPIELAR